MDDRALVGRRLAQPGAEAGTAADPTAGSEAAANQPELSKEAANHKAWQEVEKLSKEALGAGCTLCCRSMSKLLEIRKESAAQLDINALRQLWDVSMQFLLCVEKIHGSYMMTLREVLLDLLKAFLEHFHESKMQALSATLDSEPWKQVRAIPQLTC